MYKWVTPQLDTHRVTLQSIHAYYTGDDVTLVPGPSLELAGHLSDIWKHINQNFSSATGHIRWNSDLERVMFHLENIINFPDTETAWDVEASIKLVFEDMSKLARRQQFKEYLFNVGYFVLVKNLRRSDGK